MPVTPDQMKKLEAIVEELRTSDQSDQRLAKLIATLNRALKTPIKSGMGDLGQT